MANTNNVYTTKELSQLVGLSENRIMQLDSDAATESSTSEDEEMSSMSQPCLELDTMNILCEVQREEQNLLQHEEPIPLPILTDRSQALPINYIVDHGNLQACKKRSHKPRKTRWKENMNMKKRMEGKEYLGFDSKTTQVDTDTRKSPAVVLRKSRTLGPTCTSKTCQKTTKRFCSSFSEEDRKTIFQSFWANMDWNQKHTYVTSLVDKLTTKQVRGGPNSRRSISYHYYLKRENEKMKVCKGMFLSTLGLREKQFQGWMRKPIKQNFRNLSGIQEEHKYTKKQQIKKLTIHNFLDSLPKMPSHYCRKNTTKLYLEPTFKTKNQLYEVYKKDCNAKELAFMSQCSFDGVIRSKNISLFSPKKDKCDLCCSQALGQVEDSIYRTHIRNKDTARDSKASDKKEAIKGKCHVLTMDMESVKLSPTLKASSLYYKSKLIVHNFTLFDLVTHDAKNYWWNESEGQLCASTFTSCVINFLSRYDDGNPIIIYSDGCTNQNRNSAMSNGLLRYATEKGVVLYQKFLEKGHTQMEVDSVHSCIECALKNVDIYHPEDFHNKCLLARVNPHPYESVYLDHTFFTDFAESKAYEEIRPGKIPGDPKVVNIRCLKYSPNGTIEYKLSYNDEWTLLPRKPKTILPALQNLYNSPLKITKKKWTDLQALKPVIPLHYHHYYDNLPYDENI